MSTLNKQQSELVDFFLELADYGIINLWEENSHEIKLTSLYDPIESEYFHDSPVPDITVKEAFTQLTSEKTTNHLLNVYVELGYKIFTGQYENPEHEAYKIDQRYSKEVNRLYTDDHELIYAFDDYRQGYYQSSLPAKAVGAVFSGMSSCQDMQEGLSLILHPKYPILTDVESLPSDLYISVTAPYVAGFQKPLHPHDVEERLVAPHLLDALVQ